MKKIVNTSLIILLTAALMAAEPAPKKQDALKSIESTRGGRHWVNQKTAPPKSPAESMKCLQTEPGIEIQLVASEPLVFDPVAIAFDQQGRMFVAEYGDYPIGPKKEGAPSLSKVVMLEDTNGDGKMDKRHIFADHLTFVHNLMAYKDGLLVGAQTKILYLKDTTGDHKADVQQTLYDGFVPAHPQMQIGCARWGLNNLIYMNYGPGKITSAKAPGKPVTLARRDFRFNPLTMEFSNDSALSQYGNTFDRWGNRYFSQNRNPEMTTIFTPEQVARNPFAIISKAHYDVGPSGGDTRVYPLVAMKSNYLSHAGTHTSACGVTAYLGDLLPGNFQNSVFTCEPIGHLVTRSVIKPQGPRLIAKRAREKADFVASTDTWFRPASLATGPDGALYLADMYRLWVEHPKFLPKEIADKLNWREGEDRGRIYRFLPAGAKRKQFQPPQSTADFVNLLKDNNDWRRYLGQRLLVERQAKEATPALQQLLTHAAALTRLHALWTLDGLGTLTTANVLTGLKDSDWHVRSDAIKLATGRLEKNPELLSQLYKLADDDSAQVRFQLALALGETDDSKVSHILSKLALRDGEDEWFALAILSSAEKHAGDILLSLIDNSKYTSSGNTARTALVRQLATALGARGDVQELQKVLNKLASAKRQGEWWQTSILSGLATGLRRHRGALGRTSLSKLIATPPAELKQATKKIADLLESLQRIALNKKLSVADRVVAIHMLGHKPYAKSVDAYRQLMTSAQPVQVQLACIDAIQTNGGNSTADILLERWSSLSPLVQGTALGLMLRRTNTTKQMLAAMQAGKVNKATIGIDQRVRLLKSSNAEIKTIASKLFGGAISSNRREVATKYKQALGLKSSAVAGVKVFEKMCSKCHKVNGKGHQVGPDISDVRNRSPEALLYDILDPNQKVEPRYSDYTILTEAGLVFSGLLVSENAEAVILRLAEGKQQVIQRDDIDQIKVTGKSLMPEGVEKDVTIQQMADLLAFLKGNK